MYATVTHFLVDPGEVDLDIAQGVFERVVVPEMRKQPGYEGAYLLRMDSGKGMIVALWEDEAAATASEHGGYYAQQVEKLLPLLGSPPEHESYRVGFADHPLE